MTHPLHSDHCKCECDQLAKRLEEIIAAMKSNNGSHQIWIDQLENAVQGDHDWNKISEVVRYLNDL
jgi:hypothetical protein